MSAEVEEGRVEAVARGMYEALPRKYVWTDAQRWHGAWHTMARAALAAADRWDREQGWRVVRLEHAAGAETGYESLANDWATDSNGRPLFRLTDERTDTP